MDQPSKDLLIDQLRTMIQDVNDDKIMSLIGLALYNNGTFARALAVDPRTVPTVVGLLSGTKLQLDQHVLGAFIQQAQMEKQAMEQAKRVIALPGDENFIVSPPVQ